MTTFNDTDGGALQVLADSMGAEPTNVEAKFGMSTHRDGQVRSMAAVKSCGRRGQTHAHGFTIGIDEPIELLDTNTARHPQEVLQAALNACMTAGHACHAAVMSLKPRSLESVTTCALDLLGFPGLDESIIPGHDEVQHSICSDGGGTHGPFEEIHQAVMRTAPSLAHDARPVHSVPRRIVDTR